MTAEQDRIEDEGAETFTADQGTAAAPRAKPDVVAVLRTERTGWHYMSTTKQTAPAAPTRSRA